MDSLHFYLYHLFDCGYRIEGTYVVNECYASGINTNNQYFDSKFSRIYHAMNQRKDSREIFIIIDHKKH